MDHTTSSWNTIKFCNHLQTIEEEEIVRESAITVVINGKQYATIVCTPTNVKQMIIGFLASEGIIRFLNQIDNLTIDETKGFAYVNLCFTFDFSESRKRWVGSCCGKSREFYLKQDVKAAKTVMNAPEISSGKIAALIEEFDQIADIYGRTGGVHQAALADENEIISSFIDIGRHNALDKLHGFILENSISIKDKCILFSGRISSEVVLKVSKIGSGILLAKSAPTDLALKLADDLNITAVGFIRKQNMNVYTHKERILDILHQDVPIQK